MENYFPLNDWDKQGYSLIISKDGEIEYISPSLFKFLGVEHSRKETKKIKELLFPLFTTLKAFKEKRNKGFFLCVLYARSGMKIVKGFIQEQNSIDKKTTNSYLVLVEPINEDEAITEVLRNVPEELLWKTGKDFIKQSKEFLTEIFHLDKLCIYHYSQNNFIATEEKSNREMPEEFRLAPDLVNELIEKRKLYLTALLETNAKSLSNYFLFPILDEDGNLKYAFLTGTRSFWMLAKVFSKVLAKMNNRIYKELSSAETFWQKSKFLNLLGVGSIKKLDKMVSSLNLQSLDISNVLVPFKQKGKSRRMYLSINVHDATGEVISLSSVISHSESSGEHKMLIDRNILKLKEDLEYYKLFYNLLFENSMEAVFIYDLQGKFIQANKVARQLIGASEKTGDEEFYLKDILPENEQNTLQELIGKRLFPSQQSSGNIRELKIQTLTGEEKYIESWGLPFYRNGEIYFMGIARDITEKVLMRKRLELVLNSVDEIILLVDGDGTIEYTNNRLTELLGYPKASVIGKKIEEFAGIFPEGGASGERILTPYVKEKQPLVFSYKINPITSETQTKRFLISLFNISQQKLLARLLDYFFIHAPLGLLLIDNSSGKILKYNQAGLDILELPEEELLRYPVPVLLRSGAFLSTFGQEEWKGVMKIQEKKVKVYKKALYIPAQSAGITIIIMEDITKEEQQAEQLKTIEFAVSNIPEGIIIAKQKNSEHLEILYKNNKAHNFWKQVDTEYQKHFYLTLHKCVESKENSKKLDQRITSRSTFMITEVFINNQYYELSVYPLQGSTSQETVWVIISRNINTQVEFTQLKEKMKQQEFALKLTKLLDREESKSKKLIELLHDNIATPLSTITWTLDSIIDNVNKCQTTAPEVKMQTRDTLTAILQNINSIVNLTRSVSHELKFDALADLGLIEAISGLCKLLSRNNKKQGRELNIVLDVLGDTKLQIQDPLKLNIFRIIQELLNNIIKHSTANEVFLTLEINKKSEHNKQSFLFIYIEENGQGFDIQKAKAKGGIGLTNIEEKIKAFGGTINWGENGTYIEIIIPLLENLIS